MLVVGDREEETGAVAVRSHADGELGEMSLAEFADRVEAETGAAPESRSALANGPLCLYTAPNLTAGTQIHRRR